MRKVLVLFLWVIAHSVIADELFFRKFDQSPLLYGISVNQLLEDEEGYLWLGTSKGLFRYDGYALRNQHEYTPDAIRENEFVTNLQEDGLHHLWVSLSSPSEYIVFSEHRALIDTRQYLDSLGMGTDKQFLMHIGQDGDLWRITQDSLFHYDCTTGEIRRFATPTLTSSNNQRISVKTFEDILYIVDGRFLKIFDEDSGVWYEEELDLVLPSLGDNVEGIKLATMFIDSKGSVWIYSLFTEDLLYRTRDSQQWIHVALPHDDQVVQNSIRGIAEAKDGIWIATNHRGLFFYNQHSGKMQHYQHQLNDAQSLASDNVNSLLVDSHQTLWVGYYNSGMSYYHPHLDLGRQRQGEFGDITAIVVTGGGMRWIGTDGQGLWCETVDGQVSQVTQIPNIVITDLQCGKDGSIWIGTYDQGIYVLQSGRKARHYSAEQGQLPHNGAARLVLDGYERLWVFSAFSPFYCLDTKTGAWKICQDNDGSDLMGEAICYDPKDNNIILATYWGLWIQNLKSDTGWRMCGARQDELPLHEYHEHALLADAYEPFVWMTHDRGITVWDTRNDTLYLVSRDEGLTDMLLAMRQDPQHNVWVSSPSSVAMIEPVRQDDNTWDFKVHTIISSRTNQPAPFNTNAVAVTPQGKMLFGSLDSYTEIDSRSALTLTNESVNPVFSTLLLGDSIVVASESASGQKRLELNSEGLPLTISFYTGNPLHAKEVRYSYRIKGLQDEWIETRSNYVTLLSLPSGNYEFEVKAIGLDAQWSPACSMIIVVSEPWWSSTRMRLIFASLLVLFGVSIVWFTRNHSSQEI